MLAPNEALHQAVQAMTDGPGDPTSIEGAKVNALQSIAWSLIGLLAQRDDDPEQKEGLTTALKGLGLVTIPEQ